MIIGVPRESFLNERRVALIPAFVEQVKKAGLNVIVEKNAGKAAFCSDRAYEERGARIVSDRRELFSSADIVLQVRAAGANPKKGLDDIRLLRKGSMLFGFLDPYASSDMVLELAKREVMAFAMELIPRITRAQDMDALSSMASIAGYRAALMAGCALPRMYPMLITAAGTIVPARVFVIGAGVAGLQAIATAHRIGAVVKSYDIRPAVKEQVQSLGAQFVELELETEDTEKENGYAKEMTDDYYRKERELMSKEISESDVVITTAAIPGKSAPMLITEEMVKLMPPGSVIIDLAAEQGGNCELTVPGETIRKHEVTIIGPLNLPSSIPFHASQLYSKNITSLLLYVLKEERYRTNREDDIIRGTLVTADGAVVHEEIKEVLGI